MNNEQKGKGKSDGTGEGSNEVSPKGNEFLPNVQSMPYRTLGGSGALKRYPTEEEKVDSGVHSGSGNAQRWEFAPTLFSEARKAARDIQPSILRSEEPPRKVRKLSLTIKGEKILYKGREVHSGSTVHPPGEVYDMEERDGSGGEGSSPGSLECAEEWWGEELSGSDTAVDGDNEWTDESIARSTTALHTTIDRIRDSIRLGPHTNPNTMWGDEHGENDASGESDSESTIYETSGSASESED